MDSGGNLPMFGDADDGRVVALSQQPGFCPYRSLLATGAVLFDRTDFAARAGGLDDKTRWLFGAQGAAQLRCRPPRITANCRCGAPFPTAATTCSAEISKPPREIRLVADAGPLG